MLHRFTQTALSLSMFLIGSSCASTKKPPPPRPVAEPCEEQAVLVIENSSGYDLDVVEAASLGGGRTVIATVGTGYHEVMVRSEGGYYYFTQRVQNRAVETSESMRASASDQVRMRRECRAFFSTEGPDVGDGVPDL
jgi:hypothetical protein